MRMQGWPPAVLDCHDIITKPWYRKWQNAQGASRMIWRFVHLVLSTGERRAAIKFRVLLTRSREDAEWAKKWIAHSDIRILPHPAGADIPASSRREVQGRILFLGAMGRQLNVDAALFFYHRVFPFVRERFPEAQFWVVGGNPPRQLIDLCEKDPSLRVTGFVEDIGESYGSAAVFAAPILVGGGIIVKVLDAMAAGVPVVTTTYGNEGIGAVDGEDLLIADSPEDFASEVISLLADETLRRRIGERGKEFVRKHFNRDTLMAKLEAILVETANQGSGKREK
jgi:glycosyltransferase involved in cell wall biosynthesis